MTTISGPAGPIDLDLLRKQTMEAQMTIYDKHSNHALRQLLAFHLTYPGPLSEETVAHVVTELHARGVLSKQETTENVIMHLTNRLTTLAERTQRRLRTVYWALTVLCLLGLPSAFWIGRVTS